MAGRSYLILDELKKVWKTDFLPSISREIKLEVAPLSDRIKILTERSRQIDKSQQFLSEKYDKVIETLQSNQSLVLKSLPKKQNIRSMRCSST